MRNLVLLFLITLLFFSCTIEKRRYFKGYHVENGKVGPFDRLRDRGTREEGKRGRSTGSGTGEVKKWESVQEQQYVERATQKPQRDDIIIEGEIEIANDIEIVDETEMASGAVLDEEIAMAGENNLTNEKSISLEQEDSKTQTYQDRNITTKGIDWAKVGMFIFGVYSIVAFVGSLLFLVSAIFAKDSLTSFFLLLGGGILLLNGFIFFAIYAAIKRRQSASVQIVGNLNEPEPNTPAPKRVRNALIPFVISGLFVLLAGLKLGSGQLGLLESIEYLVVFVGYAFLAVLFLIITIVRLVRKRKQARLLREPITPTNSSLN